MARKKSADASVTANLTQEEKDKLSKDVIASLQSEFGEGAAFLLGSNARTDVETSSTGSLVVDHILGGGLPKGRIIEIYGPEASGKTSLALTSIANVQKKGGNAFFIDVEHALDPSYARILGVDTSKLGFSQPSYAEQALNIMNRVIQSGAYDIVVLDSVASLVPKVELEGDMESSTMAVMARMMGKALRVMTPFASQTKTTVVFINQTRDKVGMVFGNPETTPGGKALKFYASQRIRIAKKKILKEGDTPIGNLVKVECTKNKVAPPYGKGETVITFAKGINQSAELLKVCEEEGIIKRSGASFTDASTGEKIGYGEAKTISIIDDKSNGLYDKYYKMAKDKLNGKSAEEAAVATSDEDDEPDTAPEPAVDGNNDEIV